MKIISRFSRRNDAGLRRLNVVLWENLALVVILSIYVQFCYRELLVTRLKNWRFQLDDDKISKNVYALEKKAVLIVSLI